MFQMQKSKMYNSPTNFTFGADCCSGDVVTGQCDDMLRFQCFSYCKISRLVSRIILIGITAASSRYSNVDGKSLCNTCARPGTWFILHVHSDITKVLLQRLLCFRQRCCWNHISHLAHISALCSLSFNAAKGKARASCK